LSLDDAPPIAGATARPLFVDNRDGNTLARAITTHLAALRREDRIPAELCVASCYFNLQGLELIAGEARHVPRIRLLLGADPTPEALLPRRMPHDPTEPEFTRRRVGQGLIQLERGLKHDRDLLPFDLEEDRAIRNLLDFLRSGRIEVRRYEAHFLHAKAFVFRGAERGILAGSANLTRAGLQRNLELVLGHHEDPLVARVEEWFESLWQGAVPFDLTAIYAELLWTFETDPANLQPKVRRLNREVAAFLRQHPPAGIEQERLNRCLDAVESPWSLREENQLRLAWELVFPSSADKSKHLVEEVERIGAEPFRAPHPLPPIDREEIHLICWMAIANEE